MTDRPPFTVDTLSGHLLDAVLCPADPPESELSPEQVKRLSSEGLEQVATDMRHTIVEAIERNGGHLSSNLGVVELALAIHRAFDSPHDVVIWDTGHQCYPHKMVTGRRGSFGRLRQAGGLSGYPNRHESEHDWIENSHVGGALSWAHGWVEGLRAAGSDRRVVVVVGDGALTAGVAYEALNNLGVSGCPVVVVLNDNGRSYAPTVSRLFGPDLNDGHSEEFVARAEASERFFTSLGFTYLGPVDGHDVGDLDVALAEARGLAQPVVVHARTVKGRGHRSAEADRVKRLHDVGAGPLKATM
jgi:1-deoxy-D-xylulose-5-phosphate synthase